MQLQHNNLSYLVQLGMKLPAHVVSVHVLHAEISILVLPLEL